MQNGSWKTGRGFTLNGALVCAPKRQQKAKSSSSREDPCSSTASSPVISAHQSHHEPPARSSLSSPSLPASSLHGSLPTVKGSRLKSFQSSRVSLRSCSPSFSLRSCSPSTSSSLRSSSEDDSWDSNSWSSGATCLLRSSIRQHSEGVFQTRAGPGNSCTGGAVEPEGLERVEPESLERVEPQSRRDSEHSLTSSQGTSTASTELEEKIEAKLKFSQFLDEVTCRVLGPECLQAFGAIRQRESPVACPQTSFLTAHSCADAPRFRDSGAKYSPTGRILGSPLRRKGEEQMKASGRAYLETDMDQVRREEHDRTSAGEMEKRTPQWSLESPHRELDSGRSPVLKRSDEAPTPPQCSTSLSRAVNTNADVEDVCGNRSAQEQNEDLRRSAQEQNEDLRRSAQEQNEDLRRRLHYTSHQLHMQEKEFESSRQYLDTELQQTQLELENVTEKLHRIQSNYTTLQRINQELQDNIQRMRKRHEEESRSLSRENLILKNRLIDANITIHKLQEDNDVYRRDCKLAARLLQCGKTPHQPSELSAGSQGGVSSPMEEHAGGNAPDSGPCALIDQAQETPEALMRTHTLQRRSCDVYCSDTALYCPGERRPSVHLHNTHHRPLNFPPSCGFPVGPLPLSGSYSGFSSAPEEKSQQLWRQNSVSHEKDASGFPKSNRFQHVARGFPESCCRSSYPLPLERWRPTSVEDVTFSLHSSGPTSSIPDTREMNPCSSAVAPDVIHTDKGLHFRNYKHQQQDISDSANTSVETLTQSLEAPHVQRYKKKVQETPAEHVNTGLSRKDSLTKAQLYGTLLN